MTKRASGKFERRDRDLYRTPESAVLRLLPWCDDVTSFAEPLCGDGAIIQAMNQRGWHCGFASDIEPVRTPWTREAHTLDVFELRELDLELAGCSHIISNPPWPRQHKAGEPTISIIERLMRMRPTWLLLSADFAHNGYSRRVLKSCVSIVSVGRVSWLDNGQGGFDNAAWYLFDPNYYHVGRITEFYNEKAERCFAPDLDPIIF